MRTRILVLFAATALAFAAGAGASQVWKVVATGSDSGDYATFADASSDVVLPTALAMRTSVKASVTWALICTGTVKNVPAGRLVPVTVATADKCSVNGSATGGPGKLTVDILRGR